MNRNPKDKTHKMKITVTTQRQEAVGGEERRQFSQEQEKESLKLVFLNFLSSRTHRIFIGDLLSMAGSIKSYIFGFLLPFIPSFSFNLCDIIVIT